MSSFLAGLVAVVLPTALIVVSAIVVGRSRAGASSRLARRVPLGWRQLGAFTPYLFLVGVIALYVWGRGVLGLQQHTMSGSWALLVMGLVLTLGSIVCYAGYLRRRRAIARAML